MARGVALFAVSVLASADDVCPKGYLYPPLQFSDNTECDEAGLGNLSGYRHGLLLNQSGADPSHFIPYLSSVPLTQMQEQVTNGVIWIHGLLGNANKFFCDGVLSAKASEAGATTVTVAPWFGNEKIDASAWNSSLGSGHSTCWDGASWLGGGDAFDPLRAPAAFEALDQIVALLQDKTNLPRLEQITVAGFSAGCQMASRWVFFSDAAAATRVVVGDCGTYMYLDNSRPASPCSLLENTGTAHSCTSFATPNATSCPDYAEYKYGFDFSHLDGQNSYVQPFADDAAKLHDAVNDFAKKDFRMLLGVRDYCQCNAQGMNNPASCFPGGNISCSPSIFPGCCDTYPDSSSKDACSWGCAAMLEGSNRLQRGLNYAAHLKNLFAKQGVNYDVPVGFFQGAHNNTAWGFSPIFAQWAGWTSIQVTV